MCGQVPKSARYGVFGVSTWRIGCDTPSHVLSVSHLESMRSGGAIPPPPQKGYLSDTCAVPMKTRQIGAIPPSAILSRKGIARYGGPGLSRTGAAKGSIEPSKTFYRSLQAVRSYPKKGSIKTPLAPQKVL